MKCVNFVSKFSFFTCVCPVVPAQVFEKTVFSPLYYCLCSLSKVIFDFIYVGSISVLFSAQLIFLYILLSRPCSIDYCCFIVSPEVG